MKVFKITHNISAILNDGENESHRFFSNIKYANSVFEMLLERIDNSEDEWIALDEVMVEEDCFGEYNAEHEHLLRYFSDDTKIGVNFNYDEYEQTNE